MPLFCKSQVYSLSPVPEAVRPGRLDSSLIAEEVDDDITGGGVLVYGKPNPGSNPCI